LPVAIGYSLVSVWAGISFGIPRFGCLHAFASRAVDPGGVERYYFIGEEEN
jgi:hypothetical protein